MNNNLIPSTLYRVPLGYTSLASAKKPGSRYEENAERRKNIKPLMKEYGKYVIISQDYPILPVYQCRHVTKHHCVSF